MGTPGLESREFVEQTACMAASPLLSSATQKCQAGAKDKAPIPLFCVSVGLRGQCSRHRWSPACARLGRLDLEPASVRDASCLPCRTALFTWSFYSFFNVLRTSMEPNKQRVHLSFPHWKQRMARVFPARSNGGRKDRYFSVIVEWSAQYVFSWSLNLRSRVGSNFGPSLTIPHPPRARCTDTLLGGSFCVPVW